MQHINYCYHAEKLTFNCHKGAAMNTKKKKYKKKEKTKRKAYQCPPPFIMEYLC
jgi:hypothetical protein